MASDSMPELSRSLAMEGKRGTKFRKLGSCLMKMDKVTWGRKGHRQRDQRQLQLHARSQHAAASSILSKPMGLVEPGLGWWVVAVNAGGTHQRGKRFLQAEPETS